MQSIRKSKTVSSAIISLLCTASTLLGASIPATEDSYVSLPSNTFTANVGRSATIVVSSKACGLVKFDVSGFSIRPEEVQRASLRVYISKVTTTGSLEFRAIASGPAGDWSEDAPKNVAGPQLDPSAGATFTVSDNRKRFVSVDITDLVKSWLATPSTNNGIAIVSKNGVANVKLGAKEGFGSGYPAEIEIESSPVLPLFTNGDPYTGTLEGTALADGTVTGMQVAQNTIGVGNLRAKASPGSTGGVDEIVSSGIDQTYVTTTAYAEPPNSRVRLTISGTARPVFVAIQGGYLDFSRQGTIPQGFVGSLRVLRKAAPNGTATTVFETTYGLQQDNSLGTGPFNNLRLPPGVSFLDTGGAPGVTYDYYIELSVGTTGQWLRLVNGRLVATEL